MIDRARAELREELRALLAADFIVDEKITVGTRPAVDGLVRKIMAVYDRNEIDAELKRQLKRRAAAEGVTLKDVMDRAGWNYLAADRRNF